MTVALQITVDSDDFMHDMVAMETAVERIPKEAAEELAEDLATEGGQQVAALSQPWQVIGAGGTQSTVRAPDDAWWWGFFAEGTKDHGAKDAPFMAFEVGGDFVFTDFVRGIPASHFDERAVEKTESGMDALMARVIAEAT